MMEHREFFQWAAWAIFAAAFILSIWSLRDSLRRAIRSYREIMRELEDNNGDF